jgi:hypothetical protein
VCARALAKLKVVPLVLLYESVVNKVVRIMAGAQARTACRSLFKQLKTLLVTYKYILPLMSFIISNQEIVQTDLSIHDVNIRNEYHLYRPNANLSRFSKVHSVLVYKNFQQITT